MAPKRTLSPARTRTGVVIRRPFRWVPLIEPRSRSIQPSPTWRSSAWQRETETSAIRRVAPGPRPIRTVGEPGGGSASAGSAGAGGVRGVTLILGMRASTSRSRPTMRGSSLRRSLVAAANSPRVCARRTKLIRRMKVSWESRPEPAPSRRIARARSRSASDGRARSTGTDVMLALSAPPRFTVHRHRQPSARWGVGFW